MYVIFATTSRALTPPRRDLLTHTRLTDLQNRESPPTQKHLENLVPQCAWVLCCPFCLTPFNALLTPRAQAHELSLHTIAVFR